MKSQYSHLSVVVDNRYASVWFPVHNVCTHNKLITERERERERETERQRDRETERQRDRVCNAKVNHGYFLKMFCLFVCF